jgi:predicted ATPase with chaperone activity
MGVPGAGKTLLARALPGILPEMSIEESLDVTAFIPSHINSPLAQC